MKKPLICVVIIVQALLASAQNTPLKSLYFHNPYLENPAMAGSAGNAVLYYNYSNQWNKIEGSPTTMSFSANMPLAEKTSVGFNITSERAGILERTQGVASYAYKVSLSDEQSIRLGLSLSWTTDHAEDNAAGGDGTIDPVIAVYNDYRQNYLDGNFGIAYIGERLECQFSYLNLNHKRFRDYSTVDYATFYSSVSYIIPMGRDLTVKPLLAYRGVKDYKNQWDIAGRWSYRELLSLYSILHSNKSGTLGFGYRYQHKLDISALYNTGPSQIRNLTGGAIDFVLGFIF